MLVGVGSVVLVVCTAPCCVPATSLHCHPVWCSTSDTSLFCWLDTTHPSHDHAIAVQSQCEHYVLRLFRFLYCNFSLFYHSLRTRPINDHSVARVNRCCFPSNYCHHLELSFSSPCFTGLYLCILFLGNEGTVSCRNSSTLF